MCVCCAGHGTRIKKTLNELPNRYKLVVVVLVVHSFNMFVHYFKQVDAIIDELPKKHIL